LTVKQRALLAFKARKILVNIPGQVAMVPNEHGIRVFGKRFEGSIYYADFKTGGVVKLVGHVRQA
jgi:hypothetical protein